MSHVIDRCDVTGIGRTICGCDDCREFQRLSKQWNRTLARNDLNLDRARLDKQRVRKPRRTR